MIIWTRRKNYIPFFVLLRCSNIYSFNYVVVSIHNICSMQVLRRPILSRLVGYILFFFFFCTFVDFSFCVHVRVVCELYFPGNHNMDVVLGPVRLIRILSPVVPIARLQCLTNLNHSESTLRMVRCEQISSIPFVQQVY